MAKKRICPQGNGQQGCSYIGPDGYTPGAKVSCYRCGHTMKVGHPVSLYNTRFPLN